MHTLVVGMLLLALTTWAQAPADTTHSRHHIKISYSDGLTLGMANAWAIGLSDVVMGTRRTNQTTTGVFGLGYRFALNRRCKLGADLALAMTTGKVFCYPDKSPSIRTRKLDFLILPAIEWTYLQRSVFHLYGAASTGIDLSRNYESGLTAQGREMARKTSQVETFLAYQINPIGLHVGNDRIGGFAEAGLGYKGFFTMGISLGL